MNIHNGLLEVAVFCSLVEYELIIRRHYLKMKSVLHCTNVMIQWGGFL